jgi:hypothetical protein
MILIGLAGGKADARAEIAKRLEQFGGQRLQALPGLESKTRHPGARVRYLIEALQGAERNRALGGLVAHDVTTQEEAEEIRRRGGVIWHVMGPPSESVKMEREDPKVTAMHGGCRHFLDAMDAFAEHLLSIAAAH